jgi:uncharacterized protein YfcZ (UPF0381/DUF406 family)
MSTLTHTGTHPVLECVDTIAEALDDVAAVEPVFMTTKEKQTALIELTRMAARVESLKLQVLAAADDIAIETGARSTAAWLADTTRDNHGTVLRIARLAVAVDERYRHVATALAEGRANLAQAHVIVTALDNLPTDLDGALRLQGEQHLVEQAAKFGPRELRRLGDRLLEAIAPEIADRAEYERLVAEERRAHAATRLTLKHRGDGSTDLSARLPDHVAHRLRTYLDSYTSPRRMALEQTGEVDQLPVPRRRGEAFCALLENLPDSALPQHGGTATSVMVTLDLDTLLNDLKDPGVATTSTGDRTTAEQARRLACQARIIPVVLGGKSEILDQGRSRRLFEGPIRTALNLHYPECTATGCTIPAAWCEGHHKIPWSSGGKTRLEDGTLLCPFHHHHAHDPGWDTHHHPNGTTTFTRRQ